MNPLDEAWPLYAAMRLHEGGVLYADVLWPFPPLHVVPAWIAWWIDPPGIIESRVIYAGFNAALVPAMYAIGRRFMDANFAFLGALLLSFAAPQSHGFQVLFGYRYLVFPVVALLLVDRRLRGGGWGWIVAAGALTGLTLAFRLTPAFAVACGVAVALLTATTRDVRRWFGDGLLFAGGLFIVVTPALAYFHTTVGLERLWQEVVIHPLAMLQPLPPPDIVAPDWGKRRTTRDWFVAIEFRAYWYLYAAYVIGLGTLWMRSVVRRQPFEHALFTGFVVFGAVYFIRSLGRSDFPHLDSALPPICVLLAHALKLLVDQIWPEDRSILERRRVGALALVAALLAIWIYFPLADRVVIERGKKFVALSSTPGNIMLNRFTARSVEYVVDVIGRRTRPGDTILDMSSSPVFHILTGRTGLGYFDIVMPGTFLTEQDEADFVERLILSPPGAVIWPTVAFDGMPERAVESHAPLLSAWVKENYRVTMEPRKSRWRVLLPPWALPGRPGER